MKIGILGAGLTGLTIASLLKHDFEVLERERSCGGLCRSVQDKGFTFDRGGGHIIFSKDEKALDFMLKLLKRNVVRNRRNSKILFRNRYIKYPFENGIGELDRDDALKCLTDFLIAFRNKREGKQKKITNLREWVYQTFGKSMAEMYLIPYNEKLWNHSSRELAFDWVNDRVPQPPVEDVIKSFLKLETEGNVHQLNFFYPKEGGIESLIKILEAGVSHRIKKNVKITKIYKTGEKWVVCHERWKCEYDKIISTIPVIELLGYLKNVPKYIIEAAVDLKHNSLINVLLGVDRPKINDFHWVYVPESDVKFNRLIFLSNYAPNMAPEGKSSIAVELTCKFGDKTWNMPDKKIIKNVVNGLEKKGIVKASEICYSRVERSKYAYVIYDLGYSSNKDKVMNFLKSLGIEMCGRFSEFKYMNMDACISSAIKMAERVNSMVSA